MRINPIFSRLSIILAIAAVYYAAAFFGLKLAFVNASASAVWPPTGIALAALLVLGYRVWPGIFLGAFVANLTITGWNLTTLGIAVGNTLEGLAGALLINRLANGCQVFDRARDVFKFAVLAGLLSTMVSATIGVASLAFGRFANPAELGTTWLTWWLGDVSSNLIFAPALILWSSHLHSDWNRARIIEVLVLLGSLVVGALVVFDGLTFLSASNYPVQFLIIPFIFWSAFRFRQRGAASAMVIMSAVAIWGTLNDYGPFGRYPDNESFVLLQSFMATIAVTSLGVAAAVAERLHSENALRVARDGLEERVKERTVSLATAVENLKHEIDERKHAEELLKKSEARLRMLSNRLADTRDHERRQIARELHEELGQELTGLKMQLDLLSRLRSDAIHGELTDAQEQLSRLIEQVRSLSMQVHPAMLDDLGLLPALMWHVERYTALTNIQVDFKHGGLERARFQPKIETTTYHIVQEALTNIARHAGVAQAIVRVWSDGASMHIEIQDKGSGFDSQNQNAIGTTGGLTGMRERVLALAGQFELESGVGTGTRVKVAIPLPKTELQA